ncbi:hypothetical protein Mapa_013003 [Marchantia paleacea]|nr:hypothetical protein Mapa_013003 [Marchantia paleacea]
MIFHIATPTLVDAYLSSFSEALPLPIDDSEVWWHKSPKLPEAGDGSISTRFETVFYGSS